MSEVRYVPLGPAPKPKEAPPEKSPKKRLASGENLQEALSLPSLQETLSGATPASEKDILYLISSLDEVQAKVDAIDEKLNRLDKRLDNLTVLNINSGDAARKEEVKHD